MRLWTDDETDPAEVWRDTIAALVVLIVGAGLVVAAVVGALLAVLQ